RRAPCHPRRSCSTAVRRAEFWRRYCWHRKPACSLSFSCPGCGAARNHKRVYGRSTRYAKRCTADPGPPRTRTVAALRLGHVSSLAEGRGFRKLRARRRYIGALALEEILDRAPQRRIDDVMRRIGRRRQIAARNFVLALGAGLDAGELVLDGVLDGLIIAELEVQERVVLACAPMAAEQRVRANEVDGAGDPAPVALGHHQQDAVAHLLADERIKLPRQIRTAPFARAGFHVEGEEGVPHAFGEIRAREPIDADAGRERVRAFAPDGFALARGERRQERIEGGVAGILPMELLVRALEVAARGEQIPFWLGGEGDVDRRRP